ncbi:transglycosylase domain-containing protein [Riemerella anatipestifer]|uniref:transglycosylase domain-containing protein n=1 Tax=Riemerella anatipestifer TaxID=34085 RepID=UPI001379152F|nr:transglycosylase domain-containing protein [Riemerella anatipestifer]
MPEIFYKTYEKLNPNSSENDLLYSFIENTECQSQKVARRICIIVKLQNTTRLESLTFEYFLTRDIEKNTTQRQCLNWNVQNYDFLYNVRGIENASIFYYKKELKNLNEKELEILIKMYKNPFKYNPLRYN